MIKIHNRKHFQDANKFSIELGNKSRDSFKQCMKHLRRKDCEEHVLHIFPDFVKHSFQFELHKDKQFEGNGGVILHGFQQTFSVEIDPVNYPHWSIHT